MEYVWNMYGIRMGNAWNIMEYAWNMYRICMEIDGISLNIRGICMDYV